MISAAPTLLSGAGNRLPQDLGHRYLRANRVRFHLVTGRSFALRRPLVLLVHGFGQSAAVWWHQLAALDRAGWSVAALDLRGYGDSDKPPGGYQQSVTATDIAGVIAELGYSAAVLVGTGWGGIAAWSTHAYAPDRISGLAMIGAPHPLRLPLAYRCLLAGSQIPLLPERMLSADAGMIAVWLRRRFSRSEVLPAAARQDPPAAADWPGPQRAFAYLRQFGRDQVLPAGASYRAALQAPVEVPLLTVRGVNDRILPPAAMLPLAGTHQRHQHVEIVDDGRLQPRQPGQPNSELTAALIGWLARTQQPQASVAEQPPVAVIDAHGLRVSRLKLGQAVETQSVD